MMSICFSILGEVLLPLGILAVILCLSSSGSGTDGKEGIGRNVLLSTFIPIIFSPVHNRCHRHMTGSKCKSWTSSRVLTKEQEDCCSGFIYIPESPCWVVFHLRSYKRWCPFDLVLVTPLEWESGWVEMWVMYLMLNVDTLLGCIKEF